MFVFSLDNRNIPTYTVFMLCPSWVQWICVVIYLSAKRVCLNLTNRVSKTLTFHLQRTERRPRQCAAWEDSQRTASANAFLGATRKRWRWCDGSGPDVNDPKWKGDNHGGNFHKKALQVGEWIVGIADRYPWIFDDFCYVRVNVSLEMDFCGSANHRIVRRWPMSMVKAPADTLPRSNNSGFNLSRSHEILSRRSVVTSRHDVTPQKGGLA